MIYQRKMQDYYRQPQFKWVSRKPMDGDYIFAFLHPKYFLVSSKIADFLPTVGKSAYEFNISDDFKSIEFYRSDNMLPDEPFELKSFLDFYDVINHPETFFNGD